MSATACAAMAQTVIPDEGPFPEHIGALRAAGIAQKTDAFAQLVQQPGGT